MRRNGAVEMLSPEQLHSRKRGIVIRTQTPLWRKQGVRCACNQSACGGYVRQMEKYVYTTALCRHELERFLRTFKYRGGVVPSRLGISRTLDTNLTNRRFLVR